MVGEDGEKDEQREEPVQPTFVPSEDFKQYVQTQGQLLTELVGGIRALLSERHAPGPQGPPPKRVSQEDLDTAVATGTNTAATLEKWHQEKVEPLRAELNNLKESQALLVREKAMAKMPYYEKFRQEIDDALSRFSVDMRLVPEVWIKTHDAVVGGHVDEIKAEALQAALRQADEGDEGKEAGGGKVVSLRGGKDRGEPPGRAGRGQQGSGGKLPTVGELFGQAAEQALLGKNQTQDDFARSLGYKDWPDYVKVVREQEAL